MGVNKDRKIEFDSNSTKDNISYSFICYHTYFFDTKFLLQDNNRRSHKFHHKSIILIDNQQQHWK